MGNNPYACHLECLHDQPGGAEKSKIATKIRSRIEVLKRDGVKIILVIK
jgi:hypothetical protein